jgi:hypothetical protein
MDRFTDDGLLLLVWIFSITALFVLGEGIRLGFALYRSARQKRLKRRYGCAIPNRVTGGRPKARLF